MGIVQRKLTRSFRNFFDSKKSGGIVLIVCTAVSLVFANSPIGDQYLSIWQMYIGGLSIEHWINDGLMAVFFLLIGLELERELYNGELSDIRNALLPIAAAAGGIAVPALIHFALNRGKDIGAVFKTIVGGEIASYTAMLTEARQTAIRRMIEEAMKLDADAVVSIRFATSSIMSGSAEILAYGTAVKLKKS